MKEITIFWKNFQIAQPQYQDTPQPMHYYYCDNEFDANLCAQLVADGIKQATSSSLWWYKKHNERLPKKGDLAIITNWNHVPMAITKVTNVAVVPFNEISAAYAFREGEGDKSLSYWKKVHWDYYTREMKPFDECPSETMLIVCEEFETIYKLSS